MTGAPSTVNRWTTACATGSGMKDRNPPAAGAGAPTVFIVDDDPSTRRSLEWLFTSIGVRVETYPSAEAFLAACDPARPGCLLVDLRLPGLSGTALQEALAQRGVTLPVIIVTGFGAVPSVVQAFKNGAFDFLEKPISDQLLLDRVHAAFAHDAAQRVAHRATAERAARLARLTPRERDVLRLTCAGKTAREIADALGLSPRTVEAHRARCMTKLGAGSLAELLRFGCEGNL